MGDGTPWKLCDLGLSGGGRCRRPRGHDGGHESQPDAWDLIVGIPISRWACARNRGEIGRYVADRDAGRLIIAYPDGHWPQTVDQLAKAVTALGGSRG